MAVADQTLKIAKKVNSKKILKEVEKILNELGIKDSYELSFKDITEEDSFFKPFYAVGIDIHKRIPEKKRIEIKDKIGEFLRENYGYNIGVDVITD
ncbi:MAG: hypothetical protein GXN94_01965 [Aquificae bacterium]|nr:hypothetical protein [Aquificota bacterium]